MEETRDTPPRTAAELGRVVEAFALDNADADEAVIVVKVHRGEAYTVETTVKHGGQFVPRGTPLVPELLP